MKIPHRILTLLTVVILTSSAAAPDVISPGQRFVDKDIRVSSGKLAETHFVFVLQGGGIIDVTTEAKIRAYLFTTNVYVAPKNQKKALLAAFAPQRNLSQQERDRYYRTQESLLKGLPKSKPLEGRQTVPQSDPVYKINLRYTVKGIKNGTVELTESKKSYGKDGKLIAAPEKARQSHASLLFAIASAGVVGLGFVAMRRDAAIA